MSSFLTANDVAEILNRKPAYAYKVIRTMNEELEKQGYITFSGRVPTNYFYERSGAIPPESV